MKTFIYISPT
jgi:hypothetical protein